MAVPSAPLMTIGGRPVPAADGATYDAVAPACNSSVHTEAPFGGMKQSGMGRELGMAALEHDTETKNIDIDLS